MPRAENFRQPANGTAKSVSFTRQGNFKSKTTDVPLEANNRAARRAAEKQLKKEGK